MFSGKSHSCEGFFLGWKTRRGVGVLLEQGGEGGSKALILDLVVVDDLEEK